MESMANLLTESIGFEIKDRFRQFLPVVVDLETSGFDAKENAILEIAAVPILMDEHQQLYCGETFSENVTPFPGAILDQSALDFTGIDVHDPDRSSLGERQALTNIFKPIRELLKVHDCKRAIMVAHNAHFDLGFINAACARLDYKKSPFHPFSCFDTATLAGLIYGQTVLARACDSAKIPYDSQNAHSADYDAEVTAKLFCNMVNRWSKHFDWKPS